MKPKYSVPLEYVADFVFSRSCDPRWLPERNLYTKPIWVYWIEILISNFKNFIPEVTPKEMKVLKIAAHYQKLQEIARNNKLRTKRLKHSALIT